MRIYTDASTRGGVSGIAFVVTDARDNELHKEGVVIEQCDNNTAELSAVLFALERTKNIRAKHITIFTDSIYVINAVRNGIYRKNERNIVSKIRKNMSTINSCLMWIKGHYSDGSVLSYYNKRADKMSKVVRRQYEKQLRQERKAYIKSLGFSKQYTKLQMVKKIISDRIYV